MSLKEIITGGPKVQNARATIKDLGPKAHLPRRSQRRLDEAREVSRRHVVGLILKGTGLLGVVSAAGIGIVAIEDLRRKQEYSKVPDGFSSEFGQDEVAEIARNCAKDLATFLDEEIDVEKIATSVKLAETKEEFADLVIKGSPNAIIDREQMESNYAANIERNGSAGLIILNKDAFLENMASYTNRENYGILLYEQIESVVQHEIGHLTARNYTSLRLQGAVSELFGSGILRDSFVQGAGIVGVLNGTVVNAFGDLEETEVYLLEQVIMGQKERSRQLHIELPKNYVVPILLLKRLMFQIEPDEVKSAVLLQKLRMQENGREEFCNRIVAAYPKVKVTPGKELLFGMAVLNTIDNGDLNSFNQLTTSK